MATLEVLQEKIKKLQVQADALIAKKAQAAVDQIRKIMIEHGLTTEAIEDAAKAKREGKLPRSSSPKDKSNPKPKARAVQSKPVPKYQDKKTGATWSGLGRAPAWIVGAKDRTRFLIVSDVAKSESTVTSAVKKVVAKKAPIKKVATKKVGAKKVAARTTTVAAPVAQNVSAKKAPEKKAAAKRVATKNTAGTPLAAAPVDASPT